MAIAATYNAKQMRAGVDRHRKPALEGYMTLEEFRIQAKASLTKILNERGIYQ